MLLSLLGLARAEPWSEPCEAVVGASVPLQDEVDVPVDVVPTLVVFSPGCGPDEWDLDLTETDSGTLVAEARLAPGIGLLELPLAGPLLPNTAYTLHSGVYNVRFTTGTGTADVTPSTPDLSDVEVLWADGVLYVDARPPANLDEVPRLVEAGDVDPIDGTFTPRVVDVTDMGPGYDVFAWNFPLAEAPLEWCVAGRSRAEEGTWFELSDPVCVSVDIREAEVGDPEVDRGGCGGGTAAWIVGAGLLGLGRRRRAPSR